MPMPTDLAQFANAWKVALVYGALLLCGALVDLVLLLIWNNRPEGGAWNFQVLARRPWRAVDLFYLLVWLTGIHLVGSALVHFAGIEGDPAHKMPLIIINSILVQWAAILLVVAAVYRRGLGWLAAFGLERRHIPRDLLLGAVYYLAALPFVWLYSWIYQFILIHLGYYPQMQEVAWIITGGASWGVRIYMLGLAAVLAPAIEELVFRGIGLPLALRWTSPLVAICGVSLVFALIHFSAGAFVPLLVISVAFSLAYIRTGSILVPMTMHALFNTVNVSLLLLLRG